jgi:hypothetical protein
MSGIRPSARGRQRLPPTWECCAPCSREGSARRSPASALRLEAYQRRQQRQATLDEARQRVDIGNPMSLALSAKQMTSSRASFDRARLTV